MTIKQYIVQAVAAAAAVAAGSTIITNKVNDARQDIRIAQLQDLDTSVNGLRGDLDRVDRHLSRLEGIEEANEQSRH